MAARRVGLVRRSLQGALSAEERADLAELTEAMREDAWARLDALPGLPSGLLAGRAPGLGAGLPACRECGAFEPCEHDAGDRRRVG